MKEKYGHLMNIVITGNPVDGFTHYGPFISASTANEWADDTLCGHQYWVADLDNPSITVSREKRQLELDL